MSLRDVTERLRAEGLLADEPATLRVLAVQPPAESPWYVRVFAGLGAWVAALLLLVFLGAIDVLENETATLSMGLLACAAAAAVSRIKERGDFLSQLALSLSLLGQGMFTVAMAMLLDEPIPAAMAVIGLELALIAAYADQFHRFLSGLAIVAALLVILMVGEQYELIPGLSIALAALAAAVSINEYALLPTRWWEIIHPLRTSAVVALLGLLILPLQHWLYISWWWFSALGLGAILAVVGWRIIRELGLGWRREWLPVALVLAAGVAVLSVKMPGVEAALLVLALGFWRSNRTLLGLAAAFLVFYLGAYYYSLQLTLLIKSLAMLAAGLLLLALRGMAARLRHQGGEA
ncbi:MAG TPA: DUF4401 domain-containing protein [Herpetosiphonaceae bacterium]|nr:DUF4401 domain-containing protein [Herpetosiphonaceae bacterium]